MLHCNLTISYKFIRKIFSLLIAVLPVLSSYYSGIPGFTVGDFCLVIFAVVSFFIQDFPNDYLIKLDFLYLGIVIIILLSSFSMFLQLSTPESSISVVDSYVRIVRYCFYLFIAIYVCRRLLNLDFLKKSIVYVAIVATVFLIVQVLAYRVFDYYLRGTASFIPLYTEGYDRADRMVFGDMFRATSFFLEPAHYARYTVIALGVILFGKSEVSDRDIAIAILLSIGVILSTSSQGYMLLLVVWLAFMFTRLSYIKSPTLACLFLLIIVLSPVILYGVSRIPVVAQTIERSFGDMNKNGNAAQKARLGGIKYFFELPVLYQIIGVGFGNVPNKVWMSSLGYWLYGGGVMTFCIYVIFMVYAVMQLRGINRIVFLFYCILFITDDSYYSYMLILFLSLSLFEERNNGVGVV